MGAKFGYKDTSFKRQKCSKWRKCSKYTILHQLKYGHHPHCKILGNPLKSRVSEIFFVLGGHLGGTFLKRMKFTSDSENVTLASERRTN